PLGRRRVFGLVIGNHQGADLAIAHLVLAACRKPLDQFGIIPGTGPIHGVPVAIGGLGRPGADDPGSRQRRLALMGLVDNGDLMPGKAKMIGSTGAENPGANDYDLHSTVTPESREVPKMAGT